MTTFTLSWAPTYIFGFDKPTVSPMIPAQIQSYFYRLYVGQGYELENMIGARVQTKLANETIQPETMFVTGLAARDWLATTSVGINLADGLNMKAGANMHGSFRDSSDVDRQFGTFSNDGMIKSDSVFVELRIDF
jgi:hypothetical protein